MNQSSTDKKEIKKRGALYTRVSDEERAHGYSLSFQQEELKELAERDQTLVDDKYVYVDDGFTGINGNRPALKQMIADAKDGKFEVVYVWKIDRFYRNVKEALILADELAQYGIRVKSLFEPQCDTANPIGRYMFTLMAAGAEMEHSNIRERTNHGRVRAMKDGKWIGTPPYGYSLDPDTKKLVINPEEGKWVKHFFEWFVNERLTLCKLQKRINSMNIPTKWDSAVGKKTKEGGQYRTKTKNGKFFWAKRTIDRILRRELYVGKHVFRQYKKPATVPSPDNFRPEADWIPANIPPLISAELFEAAQRQLDTNYQNAPRRTERCYLFQHKPICGICRGRMHAAYIMPPARQDGTRRLPYVFYRGSWVIKSHTNRRCENCVNYNEADLDEPIWNSLVQLLADPESMIAMIEEQRRGLVKAVNIEEYRREFDRKEEFLKLKEEKLLNLHLDGELDPVLYRRKFNELKQERADLDEQRRRMNNLVLKEGEKLDRIASAKAIHRRLKRKLMTATYEQKAKIIAVLVEKIILTGNEAEVEVNLPFKEAVPQFTASITGVPEGERSNTLRDSQRICGVL